MVIAQTDYIFIYGSVYTRRGTHLVFCGSLGYDLTPAGGNDRRKWGPQVSYIIVLVPFTSGILNQKNSNWWEEVAMVTAMRAGVTRLSRRMSRSPPESIKAPFGGNEVW